MSAGSVVWPSLATVNILSHGSLMVLFRGSMANHLMHENSVLFDGSFSAVFLPPPSIVYNAVL